MLQFADLKYFSLPALPRGRFVSKSLTAELNNFAGRLYMDFNEYSLLVNYTKEGSSSKIDAPTTNVTGFLVEWLSLRRKGQDIMHTPIGYVCQDRPLNRSHAFFAAQDDAKKAIIRSSCTSGAVDEVEEEGGDEEDMWHSDYESDDM
jgi:hypothetical protein